MFSISFTVYEVPLKGHILGFAHDILDLVSLKLQAAKGKS